MFKSSISRLLGASSPLWASSLRGQQRFISPSQGAPSTPQRGKIIKGVAAADGFHKGRACVLNDVFERGKIRPGDVLVAKLADAEWNEVLHEVDAVVLELGGKVSHAPMICRRIGIPCVSEAGPTIWDEITDGDTLIVNGAAGTIEIIPKGSPLAKDSSAKTL